MSEEAFQICNVAFSREQVDGFAVDILQRGLAASWSQAVAISMTSLLPGLSQETRRAMMLMIYDQGPEFDIEKVPKSAIDAAMLDAYRMRAINALPDLAPEGNA